MAPTPSRIVRLYGRLTTAPVAPLLSPTTCVWSVARMSTDRPSARSKLSSIRNADLDRETERRWPDEDYDFYAPEEVARRNELYEAFARRVAALQSADAGLGGRTDADEYIESDELPVADEIAVPSMNAIKTKPSMRKSQIPERAVSVSVTSWAETQPTRQHAIDSKTRVAEAPATEPKALHEPREKSVADTLEVLVAPKLEQSNPSPSMSETQRQELEMVKEYLSKVAADFEWESTASQGLRSTSEDGVIGLSAYVIAFGFEKAVKDICGVLSLESPFASKPVAIDDDEPQHDGFSRKVEKGVLRTPPRRFDGLPDAVLNRSREALIEELQRMKADSAAPQVPAA